MNAQVDERRPDDILLLEHLIIKGSVEDARNVLRRLLLLAANLDVGRTIGDALSELVKEPLRNHRIAVILLRCAAVQRLLPDANSTNQIIRSTVELCEGALPDIVRFLKINNKDQNVDKFSSLTTCHNRVSDILAALTVPYGDLNALLSARREIAGSLNHSIVRQYAGPFSRIYQHHPLGYGGLGLLVVFPTTVPNNSLPILHSHSRTSSQHRWEPLFPRFTN